jgi:pyrimidine-specific ribonucleoside hydrolase
MMKNFILDVDTGIDDACALLFAARHPEINLIGVTCVDGNTNLTQVVKNTFTVLNAAGAKNVPVAAGATRPLIQQRHTGAGVHGSDGLGGLSSEDLDQEMDPRPAVEMLRDLIERSSQPVTLIPMAPLTNIALFLRAFPETAKKLERIVLMGGSATVGNATATAEFNVWHDPEAAAIVFSSGIPITMYGLDVFDKLAMTQSEARALINSGGTCGEFSGKLLDAHFSSDVTRFPTLGDYGAVAVALYPHLGTMKKYRVLVDTTFGPNRGQTICDKRPFASLELTGHEKGSAEVEVVVDIDVEAIKKLWIETVSGE